jgi:hypothetical protein
MNLNFNVISTVVSIIGAIISMYFAYTAYTQSELTNARSLVMHRVQVCYQGYDVYRENGNIEAATARHYKAVTLSRCALKDEEGKVKQCVNDADKEKYGRTKIPVSC